VGKFLLKKEARRDRKREREREKGEKKEQEKNERRIYAHIHIESNIWVKWISRCLSFSLFLSREARASS